MSMKCTSVNASLRPLFAGINVRIVDLFNSMIYVTV